MSISFKQIGNLLRSDENEHLEFKEARERFDFEKLVKYCVTLANEGGGRFILVCILFFSHATSSSATLLT